MKKTELARKIGSKTLGRHYQYGYVWDWGTGLEASGTEDFNDPYILAKGNDFIDGGAAYGFWTVRASQYYHRVVAFEPDPRLYSLLEKNVRVNSLKNVLALPVALSALIAGESTFFRYGKGESSLLAEHMGLKPQGDAFHVPLTTIDRVVETQGLEPSTVKLDVEGAELDVLKGAVKTVSRFKPKLLIEVHHPTEPNEIREMFPEYKWTDRFRYLNNMVYPMKVQTHLLGLP